MNKQPQISYTGVKYWYCWLMCWGSFLVSACGFSTSVTTTITDKESKAQRNWATSQSLHDWRVELGRGTQFTLKLVFSNLTLSCFYNLYYKDIHCIVTPIEKMTFWNKNSIRMSFYRKNYKKYKHLFLIMQIRSYSYFMQQCHLLSGKQFDERKKLRFWQKIDLSFNPVPPSLTRSVNLGKWPPNL